jgi:nucleolar protein 58
MLALFETPAGFALFKVLKEGKLDASEELYKEFETPDAARKMVKLKAFDKFENTTDALNAATHLVDSKLPKGLRKFLKTQCQGETLAIADSKLGKAISDKLEINCINNAAVAELMRGLRSQLSELISGLAGHDMAPMSLGLSHSLSRYKLKFSPDKVDTMIVQAIGLLDDLDKELNTYAMRVREWYGWHFPELAKIVQDNVQFAKAVKLMGARVNAADLDFSGILQEEVESEMKEAAVISMGTEVSDHDMLNIKSLCDQVIALSEYRGQLFDYLKSRMNAIAPNLTIMVGELVGARLIAHAGSLINLAKHPASTVQILGAEKALFRALKTKHETPKYGLIYHASLIGQAAPKFKGKISRVLAAKSALSIRMDALGDSTEASIGLESRAKVEARLRQLEGKALAKPATPASKGKPNIEKYDKDRKAGTPGLLSAAKVYNTAADVTMDPAPATDGTPAKKKKKSKEVAEEEPAADVPEATPPTKKKKKSKEAATPEATTVAVAVAVTPELTKSGKKKRKAETEAVVEAAAEAVVEAVNGAVSEKKKKKKKSKDESA